MRPHDGVDLARVGDAFVVDARDRTVKRGYLRHLVGASRVLDVGCGAGRFLDILKAAGIDCLGIDQSQAACAQCARLEHRVLHGDALVLLRRLHEERERFEGALLAHVVEHLPAASVLELFAAIGRVLTPGGKLVVVTPNVRNLIVLQEVFWLDPTHVRPYPRALLAQIGMAAGLHAVASYDDPATVPVRSPLRRAIASLRSVLSGADRSAPMDAVVVFTAPA